MSESVEVYGFIINFMLICLLSLYVKNTRRKEEKTKKIEEIYLKLQNELRYTEKYNGLIANFLLGKRTQNYIKTEKLDEVRQEIKSGKVYKTLKELSKKIKELDAENEKS